MKKGFLPLLAGLLLAFCPPASAGGGLSIGVIPVEDALPFLVMAEEKSLPGLKVVPFQNGPDRDRALREGRIDGCLTDPLATALLRSEGVDVAITTITSGSHPHASHQYILAGPRSSITSLTQLKGVPVALARNTITEYVTDSLLAEAGFAPGEIVKQDVPSITPRYQALMEGRVSAAILPDSVAFLAESQGARRLISDNYGGRILYQRVLVFSRRAMGGKKAEISRLFQLYDPLVARLNGEREKHRPLLLKGGGVPGPVLESYSPARLSAAQLPDRDAIQPILSWAKAKGLLKRAVAYEEMVEGGFLP